MGAICVPVSSIGLTYILWSIGQWSSEMNNGVIYCSGDIRGEYSNDLRSDGL